MSMKSTKNELNMLDLVRKLNYNVHKSYKDGRREIRIQQWKLTLTAIRWT